MGMFTDALLSQALGATSIENQIAKSFATGMIGRNELDLGVDIRKEMQEIRSIIKQMKAEDPQAESDELLPFQKRLRVLGDQLGSS